MRRLFRLCPSFLCIQGLEIERVDATCEGPDDSGGGHALVSPLLAAAVPSLELRRRQLLERLRVVCQVPPAKHPTTAAAAIVSAT